MVLLLKCSEINFKGKFLEFRLYHKFADILPKLSESTLTKKLITVTKTYKVKSIR